MVGLGYNVTNPNCAIWKYGLSSFQAGDTKLERFLPKNQHTQRIGVVASCQKSGIILEIKVTYLKLML